MSRGGIPLTSMVCRCSPRSSLGGIVRWAYGLTAAALRRERASHGESRPVRLLSDEGRPLMLWRSSGWQSGGDGELVVGVPGLVLVVEGVVAETAVEDADEPVREGAKGLVVAGPTGPLTVVAGAGAG
jgi:hypothetical protein